MDGSKREAAAPSRGSEHYGELSEMNESEGMGRQPIEISKEMAELILERYRGEETTAMKGTKRPKRQGFEAEKDW